MAEKVEFAFDIDHDDFVNAGNVSSKIKKHLTQLGLNNRLIRNVAITAYEAEMNLIIHSCGGMLQLSIDQNEIELISKDSGPGIDDVDLAMKEGFSTATEKVRELGFGAGMGLPNMKRLSDDFIIHSTKNGTTIRIRFKIILD
ncbi:ATP-binding protein [Haloplasma contractile]|uniref:ATP-binding region ATPase domain protein n=1 Tax=Haloplasma contractile SSD-17B TaxID=1033810 RepID=U2FIN3_9MOLU|nr:ATP-binding protein [Haloplasma contractile]ERJ11099.1 ATP-binding region ATPase domain protein [Haloplasma contractile SSD-17B]